MNRFISLTPSWQFSLDSLSAQHQSKRLWTICWLLLLLIGCGSQEESSTQSAPAPAPIPTTIQIPSAAESTPTRPNSSAATTATPPTTQQPPNIPQDDLPNSFLAGAALTNFEIVTPNAESEIPDPRAEQALLPPPGTSSSHFTIAEQLPRQTGTKNPQLRLPANFIELPDAGYDSTGWPLKIQCTVDLSVMALIPAGISIQGKDGAAPSFGPQHSTYLSAYYLDIHEVTLGSFMRYREEAGQAGERLPQLPTNSATGDQTHPVLGVAWRDAQGYLERIGKQLPTEAEWEKGARGVSGFDYPWGETRPAWHEPRKPGQISTIMSYPSDQSVYGIFDMAGNAREWCQDWYSDDSYQLALKDKNQLPRDWTGPKKASPQFHRVIKGSDSNWYVWERSHASSNDRLPDVGFRGVLRLPR